MKKLQFLAIATILGAFIDTVFDLKLLQEIGIPNNWINLVKLLGLFLTTTVAYYTKSHSGKTGDIGGTNPPVSKDEK